MNNAMRLVCAGDVGAFTPYDIVFDVLEGASFAYLVNH